MTHIKLTIGVPTAGMVCMGFAASLVGVVTRLSAKGCPTLPEATIECKLDVVESSNWITNRERIVSRAIEAEQTHLLFLDDDMVFESGVLELLLGRRQPVVAVNYLIKNDAREFVAVTLAGKRLETNADSTGIVPVSYTGFGVSLFDLAVFKAIPQPWFEPRFVAASNEYTTEDNPCFEKIRNAGFPVYVDQDASKIVRHIGRSSWSWDRPSEGN